MSPRRQSPLTLEYVLLGLIARSPAHGYTLHKELSRLDGVGMVWQIKQSQLYALLEKLEAEKLIEAVQVESESYPPRKSYQLTEEGRKSFEQWRSAPVTRPRDLRQEFLARLYFARLAGPEVTQRLLNAQEGLALAWLLADQNELASLSPSQDYELTVLHFRIRQIEASLDWLHYCKSIFEDKK
jgi:PadR family transcriptional regulator, regulatory protein AphA